MTATIYQLNPAEFIDFTLLSIKSNLDDYRIVFHINQALSLNLSRVAPDIECIRDEFTASFSCFMFEDFNQDLTWRLLQNKSIKASDNNQVIDDSLFSGSQENIEQVMHLLPNRHAMWDYFLQIKNADLSFDSQNLIEAIAEIKGVSLIQELDVAQIKNSNDLIF